MFRAFEQYGIKFDAVAGTSIGSLFATMYASGMISSEMQQWAMKAKDSDFRKSKLGFLPSKMDNLAEMINKILPNTKLENLKIPCYVVAVDVRTGEEKHFSSGDIAPIITGSCAIPGVFCPVKYKNMVLVDKKGIIEESDSSLGEERQNLAKVTNNEKLKGDLSVAIKNADVVYADTWVSMGQESEKEEKIKVFSDYQINKELFSYAKPDAIFLHCLPAYRGYEVTEDVIDGPNSVIFDEAENRLHAQKAVMVKLMQ